MKAIRILSIGLLILFSTSVAALAQISAGGEPVTHTAAIKSSPPAVTMGQVDIAALLVEDSIEEEIGLPYRFGFPFDVSYSLQNSGVWEDLADGGRIWRLAISSPGAFSINLLYENFWIPQGAKLWVYSQDRSMTLGAFTDRNNKDHGQFATAPVSGDAIVVEYYEPANVRGQGRFTIWRVVHAYKDMFNYGGTKYNKGYGSSGSCNNNANCPIGDDWQVEKRSVAMILLSNGTRWCSGSMINNVREDETPYFLTANHCLGGESNWIIMFKYESPGCTNQNGPTNFTVQGTTLLASSSTSDFALVLLDDSPPESYNIAFSGWSNINTPAPNACGIHHPAGDIKKISFDYDAVNSANYLQTSGTTHWRVAQWDDGTTEGGSSGSPLYDPQHRIVGQLHGGYASCASLTADWYGKFSLSWDGSSSSNRLRDWLDPDNTGATILDAYDPYAGVKIVHSPLDDTRDTTNAYEVTATISSNNTLINDSLKLFYRTASTWYEVLLSPGSGPDEFEGSIPAQSPGTDIEYYLFAADDGGTSETTDTYGFSVIDYRLELTPLSAADSAVAYDTVWYSLEVTNTGVYDDSYSLTTAGNAWAVSFWDDAKATQIAQTQTLVADQAGQFFVAVEVPNSIYGDSDAATISVTSMGDGSTKATAVLTTVSNGARAAAPWSDPIANLTIDDVMWIFNDGAEVTIEAQNPPSPPYALNLDGGDDLLVSQAINLEGMSGFYLSYAFQRGGSSAMPSSGDDLSVEYLDQYGVWQLLNTHPGDGMRMTDFEFVSLSLPADAQHLNFQIRFSSEGDCVGCDDWFVDDIRIDFPPTIAPSPSFVMETVQLGDSTDLDISVNNNGTGHLSYVVEVQQQLSTKGNFKELLAQNRLQPARRTQPAADLVASELKGQEHPNVGLPVTKDAGGPDLFGYFWVDSDEPTGPEFNWVDVSATGTDVVGALNDDNWAGPYNIGFDFPFYEGNYSQLYLGSNGIIGFDTTNMRSRSKVTIPSSSTPNNFIAWLWDDLNPDDADNAGAHVYIDATVDRCVIQFVDYPEYSALPGDVITAEVILYPDGSILIQYLYVDPDFDASSGAVGIENVNGTDGLEVAFATTYAKDSLALLIVKPYQWISATPYYGQAAASGFGTINLTLNSAGLDTGTYDASVILSNNDPMDNPTTIPVQLTVVDGIVYICGDVDNSGGDPDIADLVYLVDFMFNNGPEPPIMASTDTNGDGSPVPDIGDLVYLVNYMFTDGPAPICGG